MKSELENLLQNKKKICLERDLCAELYNLWITKLHEFQDDPIKYELYVTLINNMEPYGYTLKEEIRSINREICKIYGVDSIKKTPHMQECVYKYGLDKPNA
jgi:hypothetical protein